MPSTEPSNLRRTAKPSNGSPCWGILGLLAAVHCAFLVMVAQDHTLPMVRLETDGIAYMARSLTDVWAPDPFHGPGYSMAIWLLSAFGLEPFAAAKAVSIAASTALIPIVGWCGTRVLGRVAGIFSATLLCLNPMLTITGSTILSDALAASLIWLGLTLAIGLRQQQDQLFGARFTANAIAAGLALGLAVLTREVSVVAIPAAMVTLWPTKAQERGVRGWLLLALGAAVPITGWLWLKSGPGGSPFQGQNHLNVAFAMIRGSEGWNAFPTIEQYPDLWSVITREPRALAISWANTAVALPQFLVYQTGVWAWLAIPGAAIWLFRSFNRQVAALFIFGLAYCTTVSLVWLEPRFLLPVVPLVALGTAALLSVPWIESLTPWSQWRAKGAALLASGVLAFALLSGAARSMDRTAAAFADPPLEYQGAARWLKPRVTAETKILAAKPHVPFFSGATFIGFRSLMLHKGGLERLSAALTDEEIDYVVWDERYGAVEFPGLRGLSYPREAEGLGLEAIYSERTPRPITIFRVLR